WSEAYLFTAEVTSNVNDLISTVLVNVEAVTAYPPTWADDDTTAIWGPFSNGPLDPNDTAVTVHYDANTDIYTWSVSQKPKDAGDDEYQAIISGQVEAGATEEASEGWFAIDFELMHELNPTEDLIGKFICTYGINGDNVKASAAFEDFGDSDELINALYHYEQVAGGDGFMDLVIESDFTDGGEDELGVMRSRWTKDGAGRADSMAMGGDLGDTGLVPQSSECWNSSFEPVFYTDNWSLAEEGDVTECVFEEAEFNDTHDA
ncbi:MAG: hypothetical protein HN348_16635, partial [Proteobacteria bacterium]|nr:hypothetical protein [Pseudomonadota bacterium]